MNAKNCASDSEGEEVERILDKKIKNGKSFYYLKWKGYDKYYQI